MTAQYLLHENFVRFFQVQIAIFLIAFQDAFSLQKTVNPAADHMLQFGQFLRLGALVR